VYIIAAPGLHKHPTVQRVKRRFNAEIYRGSADDELALAILAPTFIGSFGTYSWMAAFLSEGNKIHLPYISHLEKGSAWCPWHELFIHDDARITYHDTSVIEHPTSETAAEVLARPTAFARGVKNRVNPCQEL
jgi:hypothetical protein